MKFIFVTVDGDQLLDGNIGIFRDLQFCEKSKFLPVYKVSTCLLPKLLKKVLFSNKVNSIVNIPCKNMFYKFIPKIIDLKEEYSVIIPTAALNKINLSYLRYIKQKYYNINFILLLIDSMEADSPHLKYAKGKIFDDIWDLKLSFDRNDSIKFKFQYFGYCYYSSFDFVGPSKIYSDIYYIGADKGGRGELIGKIYNHFTNNNLQCNFKIFSRNIKFVYGTNLKTIKKSIDYRDVVADVKSSNCILEILQNNQQTQSIRYFEAIVYNKKLLSNNPHLSELPMYDARYMRYIEKPEDIDWKWVKKREPINYNYKNEFSPIHLLDFIEDYFNKRKAK